MKVMRSITAVGLAGVLLSTGLIAATDKDKDKAQMQSQPGQAKSQVYGSELLKQPVLNAQNKRVGHLQDLIIDPNTGRITSGVVSVGEGFAGIGNKTVVVPWSDLRTTTTQEGYRVMVDESALRAAPEFQRTGRMAQQTFTGSIASMRGDGAADFKIKTDEGTLNVEAGSTWDRQKGQLNLKDGDEVQIKGFTTGFGDQRRIVAQEISAHGKTVTLETSERPYRETGREDQGSKY